MLIILFVACLFSCTNISLVLYSSDYSQEKCLEIVSEKMDVKSKINWVEFKLFDVNGNNRSVPGASGKDYKIVICVDKNDTKKWIAGKENWITSFPYSIEWINEIRNEERIAEIKELPYAIYHNKNDGFEYTLYANEENGILLIKYTEE